MTLENTSSPYLYSVPSRSPRVPHRPGDYSGMIRITTCHLLPASRPDQKCITSYLLSIVYGIHLLNRYSVRGVQVIFGGRQAPGRYFIARLSTAPAQHYQR